MRGVLVKRVLWAALVCYLFLSGVFFGLALTPDPTTPLGGEQNTGRYGYVHGEPEANGDVPLTERYVQWLSWYATLDLGESVIFAEADPETGEVEPQPVTDVLTDAIPVTLLYLIPAVAIASLLSLALGTFAALRVDGLLDRTTGNLSQLGVGIPAVLIADLAAFAIGQADWYPSFNGGEGLLAIGNLAVLALPIAITAFNLWAAQLRAVKGEVTAFSGQQFVKTLEAGGAGERRVGRHLLKNAAPSLTSLFVSEALLTLLISMYVVEVAFGLPGFGLVSYQGFFKPDIALIVPAVLVPVLVGITGNTLQDLTTNWLDPRVSD